MIKWFTLLILLTLFAAVAGFSDTPPAIERMGKIIYFASTGLLILSLFIRDAQRKEKEV